MTRGPRSGHVMKQLGYQGPQMRSIPCTSSTVDPGLVTPSRLPACRRDAEVYPLSASGTSTLERGCALAGLLLLAATCLSPQPTVRAASTPPTTREAATAEPSALAEDPDRLATGRHQRVRGWRCWTRLTPTPTRY
jgi:hypothetical protein